MAARKQNWHPMEVRQRIKASQLINRLQANALSEKPLMDAGQIQSARILLAKSVPDISSVEIVGNADKPIEHKLQIEFVRADG